MKKLTIRELIEQLDEFDEDQVVILEGCDCNDFCTGAQQYQRNEVILTR